MNYDLSKTRKPRLLDQVRETIRTKHYSIRTEQSYVQWIRRYILFHQKKHTKDMGEKEINAFLKHLAVNRNVTASTQTQALSAILFLYKEVQLILSGIRLQPISWKPGMTFEASRSFWAIKDVRTTMIYTRVLNRGGRGVKSPAVHL